MFIHMSFGWKIAVLAESMSTSLDKELRQIGLSINQWPTLLVLWNEDGLTQSELTARSNTAHYTTTRLLDTLEKMKLVERCPHPTSRRAHLVYLTKKGRALTKEAVAKAALVNEQFFSDFTNKEQELLELLVLRMIQIQNAKLHTLGL